MSNKTQSPKTADVEQPRGNGLYVQRLVRPWMFWVKKPDCTVVKITACKYEDMKKMKDPWITAGFREIIPDDYSWLRNLWRSRLYRPNDIAQAPTRTSVEEQSSGGTRQMSTKSPTSDAALPPALRWDDPVWWPARCQECGWEGMSNETEGGRLIADTGDYEDPVCPKCCHSKDGQFMGRWIPVVEIPEPNA